MAKAISISLASGERAEQRPPRVKLTRETWEKSSDDGVGKGGGNVSSAMCPALNQIANFFKSYPERFDRKGF